MQSDLKIGDLVTLYCKKEEKRKPADDIGIIVSLFQNTGKQWYAEIVFTDNKVLLYNVTELIKIHIEDNI